MKRRAFAKKRDAGEPAIVKALRDRGFSVLLTGPLDLLVGGRGKNWIAEVKTWWLAPSDRKLTPAEAAFFRDWNGAPPVIMRCVEEALCIVGARPCRAQLRVLYPCCCGSIADPAWFTLARAAGTIQ